MKATQFNFLVLLLTLPFYCFSQNNAYEVDLSYSPKEEGFNIRGLKFQYTFQNCYGEAFLIVNYKSDNVRADYYLYNGKQYTENQLGSDHFSRSPIGSLDISAKLYFKGQFLGDIQIKTIVPMGLGCIAGDTRNVLKWCNQDPKAYKDKTSGLKLQDIRIVRLTTSSMKARDQIENQGRFESLKTQGDNYYMNREYDNALSKYNEALRIKPGDVNLQNQISHIISEKEKAEYDKQYRIQLNKYNELIAQANKYQNEGDINSTISCLNQIKTLDKLETGIHRKTNERISRLNNADGEIIRKTTPNQQMTISQENHKKIEKIENTSSEESKTSNSLYGESIYKQSIAAMQQIDKNRQESYAVAEQAGYMVANIASQLREDKLRAMREKAESENKIKSLLDFRKEYVIKNSKYIKFEANTFISSSLIEATTFPYDISENTEYLFYRGYSGVFWIQERNNRFEKTKIFDCYGHKGKLYLLNPLINEFKERKNKGYRQFLCNKGKVKKYEFASVSSFYNWRFLRTNKRFLEGIPNIEIRPMFEGGGLLGRLYTFEQSENWNSDKRNIHSILIDQQNADIIQFSQNEILAAIPNDTNKILSLRKDGYVHVLENNNNAWEEVDKVYAFEPNLLSRDQSSILMLKSSSSYRYFVIGQLDATLKPGESQRRTIVLTRNEKNNQTSIDVDFNFTHIYSFVIIDDLFPLLVIWGSDNNGFIISKSYRIDKIFKAYDESKNRNTKTTLIATESNPQKDVESKYKNNSTISNATAKESPIKFEPELKAKSEAIGPVLFSPEIMPEFPGGEDGLRKYIATSVRYPEIAQKNGVQGRVYIAFIVSTNGQVIDVKIARGVHPDLDKEAFRVVKSMPSWSPGKHKGRLVNVSYTIPINFALF